MRRFKIVNNCMGWLAFLIAAFTYCSTIEPTASFWDCPEFITTAYKLEIGHPPGAPFFMLTGNLFSQFVSDASDVARMVNTMSALLSATCILFLFWSITHLTRKLLVKDGEDINLYKLIVIMGSGMVGALAYTFSDTFWFSAVEGEVYAYSSMFTAAVFWLILKWEDAKDDATADKWLILIAYLTGLSIGVHLLNLLCIPAIVLVWYYKKNPHADLKGSLIALGGSVVLIAAVLYGIIPGVVKMGGWAELLFVNELHMSFNTGLYLYLLALAVSIIWAIWQSQRDDRRLTNISAILCVVMTGIPFYDYGWKCLLSCVVVVSTLAYVLFKTVKNGYLVTNRVINTSELCLLMMLIGYSCYALIVIRSTANTPMDQNSPEDIFTLGEYLGREQYGTRPLFYGQTYASKVQIKVEDRDGRTYCVPQVKEGAPVYQRVEKKSKDEKDAYEIVRHKQEYEYDSSMKMLFPRIWSDQREHVLSYESWLGGVEGKYVNYDNPCLEEENRLTKIPTQFDNIRFFFIYQLNFMYWRYFMWNFAGRQNDIQGQGEPEHGNWITGFSFIDDLMLGDQSRLPDELKNNKGHNVFYCLPLILGLIGLFFQAFKGERGVQHFWITFFLFFMTGIAIVIYLNQTPLQPRERDYAYAGSFYAFTIWIGLGVAAIAETIRGYMKKLEEDKASVIMTSVVTALCLLVPLQMVSQTWDDHDRSGRYTCRDFGQNYLMTLPETGNPIIFTNGDNDTFPLWYNQETEEFRTDARVCNLSYLQTDWYIDQMRRPSYDSPSLPINWDRYNFVSGKNEYVQVRPEYKKAILETFEKHHDEAVKAFGENPFEVRNILKNWVLSDDENMHFIPTDTLELTLDKDAIRKSGMYIPGDSIPEKMYIPLNKTALYKSELMMLEMLANCNWTRPMYMAITVGTENHLGLDSHFIQEGLAYRLTPFNFVNLGLVKSDKEHFVDSEKMYDNLMNKFKFGGIEKDGIYIDETINRMCTTHRRMFSLLINQLIKEGKNDKALKALEYCKKVIPAKNIPHQYAAGSFELAEGWRHVGKKEEAHRIWTDMAKNADQYCNYYLGLNDSFLMSSDFDYYLSVLNRCANVMDADFKEEADMLHQKVNFYYETYKLRMDKIGYTEE